MKVYLDNGATTKVDPRVVEDMLPYFLEGYGNASSLHTPGQYAAKALDESRKVIASSLGAKPEEIIFTSGGTESDNLALKGTAYANKDKGDHIITTKIEHPAVLKACESLEKQGFKVTYLGVDGDGMIDMGELEKSITPKTVLVSIMHANNEIGTVQDLDSIGKLCRQKGVLFHTDAVQSFTKEAVDVSKTSVDLISLSSHKIHGPKGVGVLYVRNGTSIAPISDGGGHEFKKRAGTENVSGAVGFAKAVEIAEQMDCAQMERLRGKLMQKLLEIPHTRLNGHKDKRLCNNVNISFDYIEGEALLMMLNDKGVAVSTGSACSTKSLKPSHVLLAIGLKPETAHGSIRFTLSKYTTEEEIDYTIKSVKEVVGKLREMSPLVENVHR
jgi:cysteine desulfurase